VTDDADTQGFVAIDKTNCEVFIVFRDTESTQDIIHDIDIYGSSQYLIKRVLTITPCFILVITMLFWLSMIP